MPSIAFGVIRDKDSVLKPSQCCPMLSYVLRRPVIVPGLISLRTTSTDRELKYGSTKEANDSLTTQACLMDLCNSATQVAFSPRAPASSTVWKVALCSFPLI